VWTTGQKELDVAQGAFVRNLVGGHTLWTSVALSILSSVWHFEMDPIAPIRIAFRLIYGIAVQCASIVCMQATNKYFNCVHAGSLYGIAVQSTSMLHATHLLFLVVSLVVCDHNS